MKSEAYLTKHLVNLFLVTGELGTFCHRSYPPSLDLSNPKINTVVHLKGENLKGLAPGTDVPIVSVFRRL